MNAALRLGTFLGALAITGVGFAAVGASLAPIHNDDKTSPSHGHAGADGDGGQAAPAAGGLAVAEDGYRLELIESPSEAGRAGRLRFRVVRADGQAELAFEPEQGGVPLHLIVVRRDLSGFQHLHPRMAAGGTWVTPLILAEAGVHRAFADFTVAGRPRTLGIDLFASGDFRPRPLPAPEPVARAGKHRIALEAAPLRAGQPTTLSFAVSLETEPVRDLEPYLAARGHLVALRAGDLAYLHLHPVKQPDASHRIAFGATFPSAGRYRLFLQFKREGRVETTAHSVEVSG